MVALQRIEQARAADRLGVQPFGRQEQQREVGGVRRPDILLADLLRLVAQAPFQRDAGLLSQRHIGAFVRVEQAFVILARELRIHRQPHRAVGAAGQLQREFHAFAGTGQRRHVRGVLLAGEDLFEQGAELGFAEGAAILDVGQHALQIADAAGQRLHFAEAALHRFQSLRHQPETFAQPRFQRGLQFLVHGRAHLLQLLLVAGLQRFELRFERGAQFAQRLRVAVAEFAQARGEAFLELLLARGQAAARLVRVVGQRRAQFVQPRVGTLDRIGELTAQLAAPFPLFLAQRVFERAFRPAQQEYDQQHHGQRRQHGSDQQQGLGVHADSLAGRVARGETGYHRIIRLAINSIARMVKSCPNTPQIFSQVNREGCRL